MRFRAVVLRVQVPPRVFILTFLKNYAIIYIENEKGAARMFDWDEDVEHEEIDLDEFHEALEEFLCS